MNEAAKAFEAAVSRAHGVTLIDAVGLAVSLYLTICIFAAVAG